MSLPTDDLLSALHDGELTGAEKIAAEQRVMALRESQRELSEIQQISSLLQALPAETLPSEFSHQVLKTIERELLIPARTGLLEEFSAWSRWLGNSRNWALGSAAVVMSAAGLLLMTRVMTSDVTRGTRPAASLATDARSPDAGLAVAISSFDSPMTAPISASELDRFGAPEKLEAAAASAAKSSMSAPGLAGGKTVAAKGAVASDLSRLSDATANNLSFSQETLRTAEIGDVIDALQADGDQVAVVRLTVVDRQQGMKRLQLLLAKNHIVSTDDAGLSSAPLESEAKKNSLRKELVKEKKSAPVDGSNEQMLAVFVESNSQQLAATLSDLRNSDLVQNLSVETPILLAQRDMSGGASLATSVKDGNQSTASRGDVSRGLAESLSAKLGAPRGGEAGKVLDRKAVSEGAARKAKEDSTAGRLEDNAPAQARQFAIQLPPDALSQAQLQLQSESRTRNRATANAPSAAPSRASVTTRENKTPAAELRPVQVLFVVVDRGQAAKPPAPANTSKPAVPSKVRTQPAKPSSKDGAFQNRSASPTV